MPVSKELKKWIDDVQKRGSSLGDIEAKLKEYGYKPHHIQKIFEDLGLDKKGVKSPVKQGKQGPSKTKNFSGVLALLILLGIGAVVWNLYANRPLIINAEDMVATTGGLIEGGGWALFSEGELSTVLTVPPGDYVLVIEAKGDRAVEEELRQVDAYYLPDDAELTFPQILDDSTLDEDLKIKMFNQVIENGHAYERRPIGDTVGSFREGYALFKQDVLVEEIKINDTAYLVIRVSPVESVHGWPEMSISLDGQESGLIIIDSPDWKTFELPVGIPYEGAVLTIEFTEDYSFHTRDQYGDFDYLSVMKGEKDFEEFAEKDRNLYVRSITLVPSGAS